MLIGAHQHQLPRTLFVNHFAPYWFIAHWNSLGHYLGWFEMNLKIHSLVEVLARLRSFTLEFFPTCGKILGPKSVSAFGLPVPLPKLP